MEISLRVPWNEGNFLTSCVSISSSRTQHHVLAHQEPFTVELLAPQGLNTMEVLAPQGLSTMYYFIKDPTPWKY
jgi:hypothetical protein